jgi:hypothetical protein
MIRLDGARLDLDSLAGSHPLWVARDLHLPVGLLAVATEQAQDHGPLAIVREGLLTFGGAVWPMGHCFGRTIPGVTLAEPAGCRWHGTVIEVAHDQHGEALVQTAGHELGHHRGIRDDLAAEQFGALVAHVTARRR